MIKIKRVYEKAAKGDGYRILVDRLWPRGVAKETAGIDLWLKEIAPGTELRKWFSHEPQKWDGFVGKYRSELAGKKELIHDLRKLEKEKRVITLLYSARDENFNQAVALQAYLRDTK